MRIRAPPGNSTSIGAAPPKAIFTSVNFIGGFSGRMDRDRFTLTLGFNQWLNVESDTPSRRQKAVIPRPLDLYPAINSCRCSAVRRTRPRPSCCAVVLFMPLLYHAGIRLGMRSILGRLPSINNPASSSPCIFEFVSIFCFPSSIRLKAEGVLLILVDPSVRFTLVGRGVPAEPGL